MRWQAGLLAGVAVCALLGIAAGAATIVVNPGDSIQAAINGAAPGDTIQLAAGVHDVAATITVSKGVTIDGLGAATVRGTTSAARNVFRITASGVALENLDITLTSAYALASNELDDALIAVADNAGLTGIAIRGNTLRWPAQAGAMSTWGGRAITIGSHGAPSIIIDGNTVYNTRNGIVVRYNNPAIITDNLVYSTKGGVMNYTNNQADADTRIITGNTWGTAHNEWDIVWNSGGSFFTPDYHATVIVVSEANDGAYVVDRRDASNWNYATGNRSHIFVDLPGTTTAHETNGNMNLPYATIGLAITGVADDGTIFVSADTFQEQVVFSDDKSLLGSGSGTVIEAPTTLTQYFSTGSNKNYPVLYVHDATDATVQDLVVDGLGRGNANYRFVGIGFHNAGGTIDGVEVRNIENTPFSGSQHGIGIYAYNDDGTPRSLTITGSSIHDFQKNAMALLGSGLTVSVSGNNVVIGEGRTAAIAQNGIQVGYGAGGVISDNAVSGVWYTGTYWGSTGILIIGAQPGIQVLGNTVTDCQMGINSDTDGTLVEGNRVVGSSWAIVLYGNDSLAVGNDILDSVTAGIYADGSGVEIIGNVIQGSDWSAILEGAGGQAHYNSISGSTSGFYSGLLLDGTLNWWGSAQGPAFDGDEDGTFEYDGGGEPIYGDVIFSPWLGSNPDGDPLLAGVQVTGPVLIIVDDVGPAPAAGYLDAAIAGANGPVLLGRDAIVVMDGDFVVSEAITDGVTLGSANGSCVTSLTGSIQIDAEDVQIGGLRHGFVISGPITVGAGLNATTIHINWSDLDDVVANEGIGWLDATFNYWGADGPDTVGLVDTYPYLPVPSCTLIGYMDTYGFRVMEAITFADLLLRGLPASKARLAALIMGAFGLDFDDAMGLIRQYGYSRARRAYEVADTLDDFLLQLAGYKRDTAAGGGGGSEGDLGIYAVGSLVPLSIRLVDPFTEEPAAGAIVSYTLVRMVERTSAPVSPVPELVRLGVLTYDDASGTFLATLDTAGLEPGVYEVWIGADDGLSEKRALTLTLTP